jgi:hypothetical protein
MPAPLSRASSAARRRKPDTSTGGSTGTTPVVTPPPPTGTTAPPIFFEDFLGGPGQVSHVWGNTPAVSYTATTVKIAGCPPNNGAGVMTFAGGASTNFGNGLFEIRARFTSTTGNIGSGSGPALVLWPASDQWPGPEVDIGEINGSGQLYMATHWKNSGGGDSASYYTAANGFDWTAYHTYAAFLQNTKITYYIDGVTIGTETVHPAPDFANGGENHCLGVMNRSPETTLECDWVRWTPEATVLGISTTPPTFSIAMNKAGTVTEASAGAGVDASATITTTGAVSKISWVVTGPGPNYTWTSSAHDTVGAGPVTFTPHFTATGQVQYVKYWINDDLGNAKLSSAVTVAPASGGTTTPAPAAGSESDDLAGPGGGTPGPIGIVIQAQSNGFFFCDDYAKPAGEKDAVWHFNDMLVQLTGLQPAQVLTSFRRSDFTDATHPGATLFSGTNTYHFNLSTQDPKWLEPVGHTLTDPTTWGDTYINTGFLQFSAEVRDKIAANRPWLLVRMHDEYDSRLYNGSEVDVYPAANREFIRRWRASMGGRSTALLPVFLCPIAYSSATQPFMMAKIRDAWHGMTQDATANAYLAHGSHLDADSRDSGSHWDWASAVRAGRRMAVRLAKWLWANGYSVNDLSWLPTMGPRISSFGRVSGASNQIDVTIIHNKGTDLVVPSAPNVGDFSVKENGTGVGVLAAARVDATTLRLTLARGLSAGSTLTLEYGRDLNFSGGASQITDNWHTTAVVKPTWAASVTNLGLTRMILQRTRGILAEGATSVIPPAQNTGGTGGTTTPPANNTPPPSTSAPPPSTTIYTATDGTAEVIVPTNDYFRIDNFKHGEDKLQLPAGTNPASVVITAGHDQYDFPAFGMEVAYGTAGKKAFARYSFDLDINDITYG